MEMTIDEIILKEKEIAEEFQRTVDTHMMGEDMSLEELYCDDTEVIEEKLKICKELSDYHNTIADTMRKYKTMQEVLDKVWNVPSCMLDEAECLNEIMETYRTVRW